MNSKEASVLIEKLRKQIEYHNKKYYEEDNPEIEDSEYDALKTELEKLENLFPEFAREDSPTKTVGGCASRKFPPVSHKVKMESLHDSFSYDGMSEFYDRVVKSIGKTNFVVEPKIDGISLSVEYVNGVLFRASTRGNGIIGENVTKNAFQIGNLPKKLSKNISYLEIRGECFMPKAVFKSLISSQELKGTKVFKNPRNAAAGSIRQKDSSKISERGLEILFFNIQQIKNLSFESHKESLDYARSLGLPVIDCLFCRNKSDIFDTINIIDVKRHEFSFQSDGAVVKVDSLRKRMELGSTSGFPRWAEAYKYPPEEKQTKLLDIEIKIGRTGVLTPVAVFEPIELDGTVICRASLHNEDFIREKNICVGDNVFVRKAGDIIPEIVRSEASGDRRFVFKMPEKCPFCESKTFKKENEVALKCSNRNCPAMISAQIFHFASRDAMDIEGLGESTVRILAKELKSILDIYKLDENVLKKYPEFYNSKISDIQEPILGFKINYLNKIGKNLLDSIEKSKKVSFGNLIYALGIPYTGKEAARVLAKEFKDPTKLAAASFEEFIGIDGIGEVTASSVVEFFSENPDILENLKNLGVKIKSELENENLKFKDLTFVLTGAIPISSETK